jgi:putative Holliday junction resolvase
MSTGESVSTLLGFDYGTVRIGVAVGQTVTGTANPLMTIRTINSKPDWERIAAIIDEWKPGALVVGLPYNMDDTESEVAEKAKRFARQLNGRFHLPVHMVDERLTSVEAQRHLGADAETNGELDAAAASLILETWLNQ